MAGERDVVGAGRVSSLRRGRLALLLILLPLLLLALVDLRPAFSPAGPRIDHAGQGGGALRVGAGRARVELPPDAVQAGYRPFGRRAGGEPSPIYVRSLVLEAEGIRSGIVLLELMTLPASLSERIAVLARAQGIDCSLRIATHTHGGPGGYDRALLPQVVGVGRFDPAVEEALLSAVSASLAAARAELGPAALRFEERQVKLARNRDRRGAPVDDRLGRWEFLRPDGRRVATLLRLAAHPTLSPSARGFSGDWPGAAMALLEEEGGVALALQGAVGDARPRKHTPEAFAERVLGAFVEGEESAGTEGADGVPAFAGTNDEGGAGGGAVFVGTSNRGDVGGGAGFGAAKGEADAAEAIEALSGASVLACAEGVIDLPPPDLSAMVPRPLSRLVSNALLPFAPATAHVAALRIGDHIFLGIPGEPTAQVGALLEAEAGPGARAISTAQDYVGYAVLEADMAERVLSARAAWFGAALTTALRGAAAALAEAVGAPAPTQGEAAIAP